MSYLAYVGVGSNLGDRKRTIELAQEVFASDPDVEFQRRAPLYETEPVGGPPQGNYLNTVWEIKTSIPPRRLLELLMRIEKEFGRERTEKNAPRTLDLDLLFYGEHVIREAELMIPHPKLHTRWFVLKPPWDLRADLVHPVLKKSICELLDEIDESSKERERPYGSHS